MTKTTNKTQATGVEQVATTKKGKELVFKLDRKNKKINVVWGEQESTLKSVGKHFPTAQKCAFLNTDMKHKGKRVAALSIDRETLQKVKNLKEKLDKMKEVERKRQERKMQEKMKEMEFVKLKWRKGSPLSGWVADGNLSKKLLQKVGLIRYVGGWGDKVENKITDFDSFERNGKTATVNADEIRKIIEDEQKAEEEKRKKLESMEVIENKVWDNKQGSTAKIKYEDEIYEVTIGKQDISYGENPNGDWVPVSQVCTEDGKKVEGERRKLLFEKFEGVQE